MFKNRLLNVVMALAFVGVVGFTFRVATTGPSNITGTYLPQVAMQPDPQGVVIPQSRLTGTYLPQADMQPDSQPAATDLGRMTGTYLPQSVIGTQNRMQANWNGGWRAGR